MKLTSKLTKALLLGMAIITLNPMPTTAAQLGITSSILPGGTSNSTPIDPSKPTIDGVDYTVVQKNTLFNAYTGVTAVDQHGNDITKSVKVITGYISTTVVGEYELVYEAVDSEGIRGLARRKILVVDGEKPEFIPVIFGAPDITLHLGQSFDQMAGVIAIDRKDGNITNNIKVMNYIQSDQEGTFVVMYLVENSDGIRTMHHRFVTVEGKKPQAPTINGLTDLVVGRGSQYSLFHGVTAYDYLGNDLSSKVKVAQYIDTRVPGVYTLTYSVTDSDGRTTTATRKLTVL